MAAGEKEGHRQRLRDRFAAGKQDAYTDEALLELLLCYAIPRKDIQPLAKKLVAQFGGLAGVLATDVKTLCGFDGVNSHTATLLALTNWIRLHYATKKPGAAPAQIQFQIGEGEPYITPGFKSVLPEKKAVVRPKTGLFGKAVLKEAIKLLPQLPETESLDQVGVFLRNNLHYNAEQTRYRYANYIMQRMFPNGYADQALRVFARKYAGRQELREVCFYRFCKVEPLMLNIVDDLLRPSIGTGRLDRGRLREYLLQRFPSLKSVNDCGRAIVDALVAGGIAKADRYKLNFAYRDALIPSLAFVIYSEFPEPGMYDLDKVEENAALKAMLWRPDQVIPKLYEMRNQKLLTKISEIDSIRQFTTRWTLDDMVKHLVGGGERCEGY